MFQLDCTSQPYKNSVNANTASKYMYNIKEGLILLNVKLVKIR